MDSQHIAAIFTELGLEFTQAQPEPDLTSFTVTVDAESPAISALHYEIEDEGQFLRLLAFVDNLDPDEPLLQLRLLMELNGGLPTGAFCLDPEENNIFATVNLPAAGLSAASVEEAIELLFLAAEIYDSEAGPEDGEVVAEG